jgi:hypothetical protein
MGRELCAASEERQSDKKSPDTVDSSVTEHLIHVVLHSA